jgi:hypothetical protein
MRALAWLHKWQTIIRTLRVVDDHQDEQGLIDALSVPSGRQCWGSSTPTR